ncbi:MAG TPA: sigma-70 family RNA polymerase sigma factor [Vicinamibacterales bacterium]|nr:sigma-70 family RNA polymerase sigma factor [Vicinamibacterales bacterium]
MKVDRLNAGQQALVVQYLPLAGSLANRLTYRNVLVDRDEAIAEANMGLVEAARRFDARRGVSFPSYATFWIKAKVLAYVMGVSQGQVRYITTAAGRKVFFRLFRTLQEQGESATTATVAERLGVREEVVAEAWKRQHGGDLSMDVCLPMSKELLGDKDDERPLVDESVMRAEERGALLRLVWKTRLKPRERQIVRERWLSETPRRVAAFCKEWGVSRQQVRRIQQQALDKLREAAASSTGRYSAGLVR